jgi:hypothetical protein
VEDEAVERIRPVLGGGTSASRGQEEEGNEDGSAEECRRNPGHEAGARGGEVDRAEVRGRSRGRKGWKGWNG